MPHATPHTCQDQARRVTEEVAKLVTLLTAAEPQLHLTVAAGLRDTCDELLAAAIRDGMTRARNDGWGLRPIAAASRCSHEQVRTLLAGADATTPPPVATTHPGHTESGLPLATL